MNELMKRRMEFSKLYQDNQANRKVFDWMVESLTNNALAKETTKKLGAYNRREYRGL